MPRLTNQDYLDNRELLRRDWFERGGVAFIQLDARDQQLLHRYYAPTRECSETEALRFRAEVSAGERSLPQRAGRAFAHIEPLLLEDWPIFRNMTQPVPSRQARTIVAYGLLRPEIDLEKLARVMQELARRDQERDDEKDKAA